MSSNDDKPRLTTLKRSTRRLGALRQAKCSCSWVGPLRSRLDEKQPRQDWDDHCKALH